MTDDEPSICQPPEDAPEEELVDFPKLTSKQLNQLNGEMEGWDGQQVSHSVWHQWEWRCWIECSLSGGYIKIQPFHHKRCPPHPELGSSHLVEWWNYQLLHGVVGRAEQKRRGTAQSVCSEHVFPHKATPGGIQRSETVETQSRHLLVWHHIGARAHRSALEHGHRLSEEQDHQVL